MLAAAQCSVGCTSRSYNSADSNDAKPRIFGFGGFAGDGTSAPFGVLRENSSASREKLAMSLEKSYAGVLTSSSDDKRAMKIQVRSLIEGLRSPGGALTCEEAERITVYRGHGTGALPPTSLGGHWAPSDALFFEPPEFPALALQTGQAVAEGQSWEQEIERSWLRKKIDLHAKHAEFASAKAFDAVNRKNFGVDLDMTSFEAIAGRHSFGGWGSPLLSTTLTPLVAVGFSAPFLRIRVCPGRALPTPLNKFSSEKEMLVFGMLLPEEIEFVHFPESSALTRAIAGNARTGTAPIQAVDAASALMLDRLQKFLKAEEGRKPTALETCLAASFETETSAKALAQLVSALEENPRAPSDAFLKAARDTCGPAAKP